MITIKDTGAWDYNNSSYNENRYLDTDVADYLIKLFGSQYTLLDFGCGSGYYLNYIKNKANDVRVVGVEPYVENHVAAAAVNIVSNDLTTVFDLGVTGNLLCLEVLEHIPSSLQETAVGNIVRHCDNYLIISWAHIGQKGHGHVNEKDQKDVVQLFEDHGFSFCAPESAHIREIARLWWLKSNLCVFKKKNVLFPVTFNSYKDIKGYIINLDRERHRYDNAQKLLTALGFTNISRWVAVDAELANVDEMFKGLGVTDLNKFGSYQNKGQHACALSHLKLLEYFLQSGEPYCLVFEDDVLPRTDYVTHADFDEIAWDSFDLLAFGGIFVRYRLNGVNHTSLAETKELQHNKTYVENCSFWQTHAYLCTRAFAVSAVQRYKEWVNASNDIRANCPYIDHYYTSSGYFKTKLIALQDSIDLPKVRLHKNFSHNICGVMYQDNSFKSTIQSY